MVYAARRIRRLPSFSFEDLILGTQALDDFSLTAVAPTSEDGEQELPGL
jgi:hypothetical protein